MNGPPGLIQQAEERQCMNKYSEVVPVPAATILVCKDGPEGLETFMVVRHHKIDFVPGALVFPGGKLAESDNHPEVREHCAGAEKLNDAELALQVAGIREVFEETGVLLARQRGDTALLPADRLAGLESYRDTLNTGEVGILDFLKKEELVLACDCMHKFAHWITPPMVPKRFDTHFFIARAPEDHVAVHDGRESVDSVWITPERVMREADEGKWTVIFPTRCNLMLLGESTSVEDAITASRARKIVTVNPWVEKEGDTSYICIPPEAGYPNSRERSERPG